MGRNRSWDPLVAAGTGTSTAYNCFVKSGQLGGTWTGGAIGPLSIGLLLLLLLLLEEIPPQGSPFLQ